MPHAWISIDGRHVVDTTWDSPRDCDYFGIPFPSEVLRSAIDERGTWGLLHPFDAELIGLEVERAINAYSRFDGLEAS